MEVFALMAAAASAGIAAALALGEAPRLGGAIVLAGRALPPRGLAALVRLGSTPVVQAASLLPGWGWAARRAAAMPASFVRKARSTSSRTATSCTSSSTCKEFVPNPL